MADQVDVAAAGLGAIGGAAGGCGAAESVRRRASRLVSGPSPVDLAQTSWGVPDIGRK